MAALLTLGDIQSALSTVNESPMVVRTPLLQNVQEIFGLDDGTSLHLKLESMQRTGSFKVRGLSCQLSQIPSDVMDGKRRLVSMSAGNYGKAYAYAVKELGLQATLCMPETAPANRSKLIESFGVCVERMPVNELTSTVDQHVKDGMHFVHPFDDLNLIAGYGSAGLEVLEDVPHPDIILVCCGGGGLVAGVAAAIKRTAGHTNTRVYAVEPEGAPTMYLSKQKGYAVSVESTQTIAAGLAPPYAGTNTFRHVQEFVEDVLLVSDDDIKRAVKMLYHAGLVVEPSGAAAFAALLSKKVPNSAGRNIVVFITGGNITPEELFHLMLWVWQNNTNQVRHASANIIGCDHETKAGLPAKLDRSCLSKPRV